MVVRFVCVISVPVCVRAPRVCPVSRLPRFFLQVVLCPVCVPVPPVSFYRVSCVRLPPVFLNRIQFSYCINNRQPNGSLSNVLSRLAVGVRVDGDDETQRKEHEREGDQEETRHRVLACVPSSTARDRRE